MRSAGPRTEDMGNYMEAHCEIIVECFVIISLNSEKDCFIIKKKCVRVRSEQDAQRQKYRIMTVMRYFLWSLRKNQPQPADLPLLLLQADQRVDARGVHIGMSQQIRQMTDISFYLIICKREQMPEVMRRYLAL